MTTTRSAAPPQTPTNAVIDHTRDLLRVEAGEFRALPFVKWVGGKRKLAPTIASLAPRRFRRYAEPFLGGGAMALALGISDMMLNDANSELMNAYQVIQGQLVALTSQLSEMKKHHSEDYYYEVRAWQPDKEVDQAARFVFLNKTGFNGLYRVNRLGQFNVPYGRQANPSLFESPMLQRISDVLENSTLHNMDYLEFLQEMVKPGDFVYLDPPYIPVSQYSDFKRYTPDQFREEDQRTLAQVYDYLVEFGAYPILSNSSAPLALDLYSNHQIHYVEMARMVNSDASKRGPVKEILVTPNPKRVSDLWH